MADKQKTKPTTMSQPADRKAVWTAQAEREGLTLSEWICQCCDAYLPASVRRGLSERPPAHRPRKPKA